ncbi:MAG: hypothetical protein PHU08_06410, partial [Dehalococcoidales bacterium]|nr:hypothetical protein [Dehalococcoidales bacterium]
VDNPERAVKFYSSIFGWDIPKWAGPQDYWLITTGSDGEPGINGAITRRTGNNTTVNTISVPSVDQFITKIKRAGGKAVTPKMPVPGIGYIAYCQDTEGNTFCIMQSDSSAGQ